MISRCLQFFSGKSQWRRHNAFKVVTNAIVVIFSVLSSNLCRPIFLATVTYEALADPVMLTASGRAKHLAITLVHHTFVFAWSLQPNISRFGIFLVSASRFSLYYSVLTREARPLALFAATSQFLGLFIEPFIFASKPSLTMTCQSTFVFVYISFHVLLMLRQVMGIIVVIRGADNKGRLIPIMFTGVAPPGDAEVQEQSSTLGDAPPMFSQMPAS
jgi:hypothetical protein